MDETNKARTWLPWYSAKWLSSPTRFDMSLAERAVYLDLLFIAYERMGRIPADPIKLARLTLVAPDEFAMIWPTVSKHFEPCDGDPAALTNRMVMDTIARHWKTHEARVAAGRAGGKASGEKRSKNEANTQAKTKQTAKQLEREPERERELELEEEPQPDKPLCASDDAREPVRLINAPYPDRSGENAPAKPKLVDGLTPEQEQWFGEWWPLYWRHVARKPARKAFGRLIRSADRFASVMAATRAQTAEMRTRPADKIPYPASWLNAERWNDEVAEPSQSTSSVIDNALGEIYRR